MGAKEKKPFALRVDAETMQIVEKWATDEYRSTNAQIEWMLAYMIKNFGKDQK